MIKMEIIYNLKLLSNKRLQIPREFQKLYRKFRSKILVEFLSVGKKM